MHWTRQCWGWSRFPQRGADLYRRVSMGFIHASPTTCAVSDRLQFYSHFLNSVWMGLECTESWLWIQTCTKTCAAQVNMRTMKTSRVFHCTSALDKLILRFCFRWCRMFFITREWRGGIATVVMFLQNRWVVIDPTTWEWKIPILPPLIFSQLKDSRPQQPAPETGSYGPLRSQFSASSQWNPRKSQLRCAFRQVMQFSFLRSDVENKIYFNDQSNFEFCLIWFKFDESYWMVVSFLSCGSVW